MLQKTYVVGQRRNGGIVVEGVRTYKRNGSMAAGFAEDRPEAVVTMRSIDLEPIPDFQETVSAAKLRAAYMAGAADQPWEAIAELAQALIATLEYTTYGYELATEIEAMLDFCEPHVGRNANYVRLACVHHLEGGDGDMREVAWYEPTRVPRNTVPFPLKEREWDDEQGELPLKPGAVIPFAIRAQIACAQNWGSLSTTTVARLMDDETRNDLSKAELDQIIAMVHGMDGLEKLNEWLESLKSTKEKG
jgi:hypothetical protein